jgi:hypothetical protein
LGVGWKRGCMNIQRGSIRAALFVVPAVHCRRKLLALIYSL